MRVYVYAGSMLVGPHNFPGMNGRGGMGRAGLPQPRFDPFYPPDPNGFGGNGGGRSGIGGPPFGPSFGGGVGPDFDELPPPGWDGDAFSRRFRDSRSTLEDTSFIHQPPRSHDSPTPFSWLPRTEPESTLQVGGYSL